MFKRNAIAIGVYGLFFGAFTSTAANADTVDSVAIDSPDRLLARADWQTATLKSPEIAARFVQLPDTHPAERAIEAARSGSGLDKVGYVEPVADESRSPWQWVSRPDGGAVARVEFNSHGSCGLRLRFGNLHQTADIQIRLYDAAGTSVLGPFYGGDKDDDGGWWSPTIWSESIGVELFSASGIPAPGAVPIITDSAHMNRGGGCDTSPGNTLACNLDVTCFPDVANNEARAVGLMYLIKGGICYRCTGALLNRGVNDFSPIFMTSNFCVDSESAAANAEVYWEYETGSCNGFYPATPANQPRNVGLMRLKRHVGSDWSLLAFKEPVAVSAVYLGWSSANWSDNQLAITVHHPSGSYKRIATGDTGTSSTEELCLNVPPFGCFFVDNRRVNISAGVTELGSSGAPVMDGAGRMRLVVSGREPGCPNPTQPNWCGRFDLAYANLKYVMSSSFIASPTFVDHAAAGDPGNNGASEKGTSAEPFNTVYEATFVVPEGDEVRINPGTYSEQFRVWRPQTLKRNGTTGTVRIGGS